MITACGSRRASSSSAAQEANEERRASVQQHLPAPGSAGILSPGPGVVVGGDQQAERFTATGGVIAAQPGRPPTRQCTTCPLGAAPSYHTPTALGGLPEGAPQ